MSECPSLSAQAVAAHRSYLYKYALSKLWHKAAAEDVVQETLVAALEGERRFKGDSALRTWLTAILKHKIADWYRREGSGSARDLHCHADVESDDDSADMLFDADGRWIKPPSDWPDPEQCFENRRFWETFEACLARLPQATARAFYLREIQGMSTEEICAELSVSESNCWVMLHRARLRLRDELERHGFGQANARRHGSGARTRMERSEDRWSSTLSEFAPA